MFQKYMEIKPGQVWWHYKGTNYTIILIGKHSEAGEEMVAYEQEGTKNIYFRPMNLFFDEVEWESRTLPRFVLVCDN